MQIADLERLKQVLSEIRGYEWIGYKNALLQLHNELLKLEPGAPTDGAFRVLKFRMRISTLM